MTLGSIETSDAICVSKFNQTVSGAIIVTPSRMNAERARVCQMPSATDSCSRVLTPRTSSLIALDDRRFKPLPPPDLDRVGQIVLALRVGAADTRKESGEPRNPKCHDARIAEPNCALGLGRVLLLAYPRQRATLVDQKPAVTRRIFWLETENGDVRARIECSTKPLDNLAPDERRIGEENDNVTPTLAIAPCSSRAGFAASTASAVPSCADCSNVRAPGTTRTASAPTASI